jgi:2-methylisocitrate lyase-like PEP mutase family enzyme
LGSARLFESLGAPAIATTSAGTSWALGYADGHMEAGVVVDLASRLAGMLKVPLTVDIEDGFSDDPAKVAEVALRLADVGVAGINIEDGDKPPDLLARKISVIKITLATRGMDLFINVRTDVFLSPLVPEADRVTEAIERARHYARSGADGFFVPGLMQRGQIEEVVAGVSLPLNLMAWDGLPNAATLQTLGVKRLSAGSGIAQVIWGHAAQLGRAFLETGRSETLTGQIPYPQMQALFGGSVAPSGG